MTSKLSDLVCKALNNVDLSKVKLSRRIYNSTSREVKRYQERAFMYEFYHQLRCLERESNDLQGYSMQAEVDKRYQHISDKGTIPDLIVHKPDTSDNLLALEFKLAHNRKIKHDLRKLVDYKSPPLSYKYALFVIFGEDKSTESAFKRVLRYKCANGTSILVITHSLSDDDRETKVKEIHVCMEQDITNKQK